MSSLLFSPNGRIARNRFWQGMVILTVASVLVIAGNTMVHRAFGFINFLLIYPYICVFGKRLHDVGTTAWWVIAIWLATMLVSFVFGLLFSPFFMTPELLEIQQEMNERLMAGDLTGFAEGAEIFADKMLWMNVLATIATNAVIAVGVGMLRTQPFENKHGPVPGQPTSDTF